MNVFRDPEENKLVELEMEDYGPLVNYKSGFLQHSNAGPFNTAIDVLDEFLVKTAEANKSQRAPEPAHQNL
jgi:hypothetical protein